MKWVFIVILAVFKFTSGSVISRSEMKFIPKKVSMFIEETNNYNSGNGLVKKLVLSLL